jgi:hypothetical protein
MTDTERAGWRVNEAAAQMDALEKPLRDTPLYVGRDEDPVQALKRIISFLRNNVGDSPVLALAVVGLGRVLDKLSKQQVKP